MSPEAAVRLTYFRLERRRMLGGMAVLAAGGLGACAKPPAPPPPPPPPVVTPLRLTVEGGADLNPSTRGRASPVTVRVYALKARGAFDGADFFALFERETATLGADVVKREEWLLRPGESRTLSWTLPAEATAVGVFAGYRDLARATWRQTLALNVGQPMVRTARLGARGIVLAAP